MNKILVRIIISYFLLKEAYIFVYLSITNSNLFLQFETMVSLLIEIRLYSTLTSYECHCFLRINVISPHGEIFFFIKMTIRKVNHKNIIHKM